MKAWLYAVRLEESGWRARYSVSWETDRRYWTDPGFRKAAEAGWGAADAGQRGVSGDRAPEIVRLAEPLPLGIAAEASLAFARAETAAAGGSDVRAVLAEAVRASAARTNARFGAAGQDAPGQDASGQDAAGQDAADPIAAGLPDGFRMGREAREAAERFRGRLFLQAEAAAALPLQEPGRLLRVLQLAFLLGGLRLVPGVALSAAPEVNARRAKRRTAEFRCLRCGSGESGLRRTPCASCGRTSCAYCEICLTMGRSRECGLAVLGRPAAAGRLNSPAASASTMLGRWNLSPAQTEAAGAALAFLLGRKFGEHPSGAAKPTLARRFLSRLASVAPGADPGTFLLWAVTGAGKTEMMFPLLDAVLSAGGKAAVAAPRRDVVLELAPRLAKAFPQADQVVLYGGSGDRFGSGSLTLTTAHQLIRFREAFDLVVIDEVDAFPYHNDPMLHYAAARARTPDGVTVLLSATPPAELRRAARRGRLPHARVAARHHRRPLPVPARMAVPPVSRWTGEKAGRRIPSRLLSELGTSIARGAQVFLFIPYIRQAEPLVRCLHARAAAIGLDAAAIQGTSSQDPERAGKVEAFRARTIRLLVTTTILERGVTVPKSDVFVLDADQPLFDAASLVQMAGRAGRSADDPHGRVWFAASAWTAAQRDACRQIREMNAFARRRGDLRRSEPERKGERA